MPLPIIGDTIRVAVRGVTADGDQWVNVLHFRKSGALSFPAAIAVLDPLLVAHYTVIAGAGQSWRSMAPTAASIVDFSYTPLDGTSATEVRAHAFQGVNANPAIPAQVCMVATLRTGTRGRSFRGRCYQGPLTAAAVGSTGRPSAAGATAIAVQWLAFLTALGGTGVSLVVASYTLATATNVATVTVDTRFDTQRRRLGKV